MSSRKSPEKNFFHFDDVWVRIQQQTDIRKYNQLAKIVGTSQSNITKRSKEGNFPIDWAYLVAKKYNLLTEWILEGTGPPSLKEVDLDDSFIKKISTWLKFLNQEDFRKQAWFEIQFEEAFPMFKTWKDKEPHEIE